MGGDSYPRGSPCHPPLNAFPRQRQPAEHRVTQHLRGSTVSPTFYHAAMPRQPMKMFRMGWRGRSRGASWDNQKAPGDCRLQPPFGIVGVSLLHSGRASSAVNPMVPVQRRMEALMQPPEDPSALLRAVIELQAEISILRVDLTTEMTEIKRLLADISLSIDMSNRTNNTRYYQNMTPSQGQMQRDSPAVYGRDEDLGKDKNNPPFVPEGAVLQCVRCGHRWIPRAIRPRQCAKCRAPWWFPPKWRWHQTEG